MWLVCAKESKRGCCEIWSFTINALPEWARLEPTRYFLDTATCIFHTHSMDPSSNEIGSLVSLYRYPVKSMMGEEINSSVVTEKGLLGDRQFALIDPSTGRQSARRTLQNGRTFSAFG